MIQCDGRVSRPIPEPTLRELHLYNWADCGMDLIDALASAQGVRSVVELSLQPAFRNRHPSGLFKAIRFFPLSGQEMMALFAPYLPLPQQRPFRLLAVDTLPTPDPSPSAWRTGATSTPPTRPPARSPLPSGIPAPFWPSCLSGKTSCWTLPGLSSWMPSGLPPARTLPRWARGRSSGGFRSRPRPTPPGGPIRHWSSPTAATAHRPLSFPW